MSSRLTSAQSDTASPRISSVDIALLVLRCVMGAALVLHGWQKFVAPGGAGNWMGPETPVPAPLQSLSAFAELGGGIAWVLGMLTSLASLGVICDMLAAIALVHLPQHQPFVAPLGRASFEVAADYLAVASALVVAGPGALSCENIVRRVRARLRARRAGTAR